MPVLTQAFLMWLALLVTAFANGTVRVLVLQPRLGEAASRQIASATGIAIIVALTAVFVRHLGPTSPRTLLAIGVLWGALTIAFEFLFGHFVAGASWAALVADYDVTAGRLWPFELLTIVIAPWALGRRPG